MFFLFLGLIILFILIIIPTFTSIRIKIENIKFSTDKINGRYLNKDYKITINLYFFGKIKYLKIDITKPKMEKVKSKINVDKFERKVVNYEDKFDIGILNFVKQLKLQLQSITLKIYIGTEDAAVTAKCVGTIAGIISVILGKTMKERKQACWDIMPIYQNRNILNIILDCIFNLKMIHIIYTIYVLKRKERNHGRSSNRRAYAYSNE